MYFKKLTFLTCAAFAVVALLSAGCKKSGSSGSASGAITASMGTANFNAGITTTAAWYSTDSAVYTIGGFSISGQDTTSLAMTVFPPFTLNTLITDQTAVNMDYYVSSSKDYFGGNGIGHTALTVTTQDTLNHKIAGTFTATLYNVFNASDSVMVTNGKFNTAYLVEP